MCRILFVLMLLFLLSAAVFAQDKDGSEIAVTCPNGSEITNGAEIIVNMRPGFTYTATAIGVGNFDPVMAIVDNGVVRACADDSDGAADYGAELPTTGRIQASARSAQLPFSHNYSNFADVSIVVGGFDGTDGEFVLILEGMAVTTLDGEGDPFALHLTENMTSADASVYMLAVTDQLDPLMRLVNADHETIMQCDDAGSPDFCDDTASEVLTGSFVSRSRGRQTPGGQYDAMLTLPTSQMTDVDFGSGLYFNLLMSSYELSTVGDYVVAFHVTVGSDQTTVDGKPVSPTEPTPTPRPTVQAGSGVDVTCPNGAEIVNGVEIVVNMRPGFTYTATAIGVNGFDPVMAVMDQGVARGCADDTPEAADYSASLPTTATVRASERSAQLPFSHNYSDFADISLVVGGFEGTAGEFVLILEGMAVTPLDGEGDPFRVRVTPNLVGAEVDLSAYMFAVDRTLDPVMRLVSADNEVLLECDDAGSASFCMEGTSDLASSNVSRTRGRETPSATNNAMLVVPTRQLTDLDFSEELYLNFLMTSFDGSQGEYAVAFHFGIGTTPSGSDI